MPDLPRLPVPHPGARSSPVAASLAVRTALVTCLASLVAVVITALVAVPVLTRTANREARETLNRDTRTFAELFALRSVDESAMTGRLRLRGYDVYLIREGQADRGGLPPATLKALAGGRAVSAHLAVVAGETRLVAGRPIARRPGSAIVLTAKPVTGTARAVLRRLWVALLAGLAAGLAAGVPLARRLTRPVRQAAHAAGRLTAGDRTVRLPTTGPPETAELAHAINQLAAALATSEDRQRDFLLSVSHELRTPLTTIRGYAEALADGVVGPDGARRAGATVLDEAQRLDRLISDLLVLARLQAADLPIETARVDLTQLVAATGEAWGGRFAAAGVPLRVESRPAPVWVSTDPGRIRQLVDGLLENALRVVPSGAPVVIAVAPPGPGPGPQGLAAVEVRDGGPGLTDDDLAVAFQQGELYRRYRGIRKVGSGLGLAMAARLARRLGGTIEAGHAPEGGARFTVRLPTDTAPSRFPAGTAPSRHPAETDPGRRPAETDPDR